MKMQLTPEQLSLCKYAVMNMHRKRSAQLREWKGEELHRELRQEIALCEKTVETILQIEKQSISPTWSGTHEHIPPALAACPFCGMTASNNAPKAPKTAPAIAVHQYPQGHRVECKGCGCNGPWHLTQLDAVVAWNRGQVVDSNR